MPLETCHLHHLKCCQESKSAPVSEVEEPDTAVLSPSSYDLNASLSLTSMARKHLYIIYYEMALL